MIGFTTFSSSLCLASKADASASELELIHLSISSILLLTVFLSPESILSLSLSSSRVCLVLTQRPSRLFLASIFFLILSSCSLYFQASLMSLSTSSLERRPLLLVMVIFSDLEVPLSVAFTLIIPLASISKVTSIWGTPLGAGGIPSRLNLPRRLLSLVICRSPQKTWMHTPGWLSAQVVNICDFLVGMAVFLGMSVVITPPAVSIPRERGVTSMSRRLSVWADPWPLRMAAWTAAPQATASSGLMDLLGYLPLKNYLRSSMTLGIRVEPPTRTTS